MLLCLHSLIVRRSFETKLQDSLGFNECDLSCIWNIQLDVCDLVLSRLGLVLSSVLNFCLLLPLTWAFSKASAVMRFAGLRWSKLVNGNSTISGWLLMGLFLGLWTADALEPHQSVFVCCSLAPACNIHGTYSELVSRSKIDELFKLKNESMLV